DKVNQEFMEALGKRKELKGLFTFYAANYPQYELIIDNELAMQKGVSIGKAMENLDILIGSTYEQEFTRFNTFFKLYTQDGTAYRKLPSYIMEYYIKSEHAEMVPCAAFMTMRKIHSTNDITPFNPYTSDSI